jgi:opacity protein-like surface antigen
MRRDLLSVVLSSLIVLLAVAAAPQPANAQGFISPLLGFDFGGDSGCLTASNCEDKNSNIGVAFGTMGNVVGFELELAYARDFFGETPGFSSSVLTVMNNFMVVPKIGAVRPYVLGGIGLFKTHVELDTAGLLENDNNSFGWDFGGGIMVLFGEHVGVRGDLRRFSTFQERSIFGFDISNERLSFNRAAAALVLAF